MTFACSNFSFSCGRGFSPESRPQAVQDKRYYRRGRDTTKSQILPPPNPPPPVAAGMQPFCLPPHPVNPVSVATTNLALAHRAQSLSRLLPARPQLLRSQSGHTLSAGGLATAPPPPEATKAPLPA